MTVDRSSPAAAFRKIGLIGLGSMGLGMARSLRRAGFDVAGYDVAKAAVDTFAAEGGRGAKSLTEAVTDAGVVVSVVVNATQTEAVLFGDNGIAAALLPDAVFISSATMDPAITRRLAERLEASGRHYLDAPMSGGAAKANTGELTFMASGTAAAFAAARPALDAMAGKIYELGNSAGAGSAFKMINQLLAGVHIAAACEAITFAQRQGLDLQKVYDVITASAGNSWMFENRVPHVIAGDYKPLSSIEIFVKDLGIVQDMARSARYPVPMAAAALQMYLAAAGAGMGHDDDSSLARVYAQLSGVNLPANSR
jgi:3-hydroxyisobutyrate dehydrogenase